MDGKYNNYDADIAIDGQIVFCEDRKDCKCCKGMYMFCKSVACDNLGTCYCMMSDDYEKIAAEEQKVAANWVLTKTGDNKTKYNLTIY